MAEIPGGARGCQPELEELRRREALAEQLGGPERVRRQHDVRLMTGWPRDDKRGGTGAGPSELFQLGWQLSTQGGAGVPMERTSSGDESPGSGQTSQGQMLGKRSRRVAV